MDQPGTAKPRLVITTPVFEGPLELLLVLAERADVDIFQVSLARLTDAYVAEIATLEEKDPAEMAEFLWLAARLLLLKSIRLLPAPVPDDEEADLLGWEEDVRGRLLEYRTYKEAAEQLLQLVAADQPSYPGPTRPLTVEGQEEPIQVAALLTALQSVLARLPPIPLVYMGKRWTVDGKIEVLEKRLRRGPMELIEVLLECSDRLEAVVTFVAVLELLRRGAVRVRQERNFGRILVEAR